jgi:membrane protease YdiL (CAAX protease family)
MPLAEAILGVPMWELAAVAVCLPVCLVVFWHVFRWWVSARDVPLPIDNAMPAVRWPVEVGLAIFLGMVVLMPLVGEAYHEAALAGFVPWEPLDVPPILNPAVFFEMIVPALAGLAVVGMFGPRARETVCVRLGSPGRGALTGLIAFAAILPVCVAALQTNIIVLWLIKPQELQVVHPLVDTLQHAPQPWVLPLATIEAMVLAPLSEEFMYRGILMTTLLKHTGAGGAIVISSAAFALVHLPVEPWAVLPLFFLGMALAYAAYRTRSLVAPIVAHSLFNGLGIFLVK